MKFTRKLLILPLAAALALGSTGCTEPTQKEEPPVILADVTDNTNLDKVITDVSLATGTQAEDASIIPHGTVTSGMVLQRRCVNCLTGTTAGTSIAAEFQGTLYGGTVKDGKFEIYLPPAEAGGPYGLTLYTESGKKTLTDIYVGEVFLLSGQSNMAFTVSGSKYGTGKEIEPLGDRVIQTYLVPWVQSAYPRQNVDAQWAGANDPGWENFSSVGYLFGLKMYDELQVPIGLVQAAVGGSPLSYWLPREELMTLQAVQPVFITDMDACAGYNGMIHPLLNLRFRGVLWYQGETNAGLPNAYAGELKFMIETWRALFNDFDLAFTIIELPRYKDIPEAWAKIRQAQQQVAEEMDYVCMSVSIDLGDMQDIHPTDKTVISARAAERTLEAFFGKDFEDHPAVVSAECTGNQVILTLDNAQGLMARNGSNGFQYSPDGTRFYPVESISVSGNQITVTAKEDIQVLRYGYTISFGDSATDLDPARHVTVFNGAGLPLDQGLWEFP